MHCKGCCLSLPASVAADMLVPRSLAEDRSECSASKSPTNCQEGAMTTGNDGPRTGPSRRAVLTAGAAGGAGALISPGSVMLAQAETGAATVAVVAAPPASAALAAKAVTGVEPAILRISREVWENAELSRQELNPTQSTSGNWRPRASRSPAGIRRATPPPSSRSGRREPEDR